MSKWKEKAWEKVKEKMKEKEGKEMEGATFKPAINPRSEKMMREKKRVPIQDRVIKKKGEGKGGWKSGKAEEKSEGKEHSINTRANRSMWG